ncbi:MAG: hypothetical protein IJ736_12795, partial [Firmicutes bacterium]|nr:hypothetical protein [Bacillota bacterium]
MNLKDILDIEKEKLEKYLIDSYFTEEGWFFENIENNDMKKIYLFYRAAVLDGIIPFSAVTGINIKNMSIKSVFDVTNYAGIKESLVSMSKGFSELLFAPSSDKIKLNSNIMSGVITGAKLVFSDGENEY